jgi:hypothetical protein
MLYQPATAAEALVVRERAALPLMRTMHAPSSLSINSGRVRKADSKCPAKNGIENRLPQAILRT